MTDDIVTRLRTVVAVPHGVDIWTTTALDAADEIERLRAVVDALTARPFRGTSSERRDRMYGSDWEPVHDALDALEARRG